MQKSPQDVAKSQSGHLIPLRTILETNSRDKFIEVYITTIPVKLASSVVNILRTILPEEKGIDLQHLRRFAKDSEIPQHVLESLPARSSEPSSPEISASQTVNVILGPTSSISTEALQKALSPLAYPFLLSTTKVPLLAPTSQEQANLWSAKYWPTVHRKSNPFGPHPSLVARAQVEIQRDVGRWMDLAAQVARESARTGVGEAIGVVVVERRDGIAQVVAVAGDARWLDWPHTGSGNVTAHAALRAIAMVSSSLLKKENNIPSSSSSSNLTSENNNSIFRDQPISAIEKDNLRMQGNSNGYLCQDLEIYCTHEPCVMCSMAIVHSRFGRIVFGEGMGRTGGMSADNEVGYGLFWRRELNWCMLAWKWVLPEGGGKEGIEVGEGVHA